MNGQYFKSDHRSKDTIIQDVAESIVDRGPLLFEYDFKWRFMNEVSAVSGVG